MHDKCYACDRPLRNPHLVDTRDGQLVWVGSECFKRIKAAGASGYQPPRGGPRLWLIPSEAEPEPFDYDQNGMFPHVGDPHRMTD